MFRSQATIEYINEKLKATWSPEQIACTLYGLKMPSWRTIYRWIYEKYLVNGNLKVLRRKGKSHGVKETRGKYNKVNPYASATNPYAAAKMPDTGKQTRS